jgi:hypothetical protein
VRHDGPVVTILPAAHPAMDIGPPARFELTEMFSDSQLRLCRQGICLALGVSLLSGCYDGNALVKKAESKALIAKLAEVDLGSFRTTLPRDEDTNVATEIDVHIFGRVSRFRLGEITRQIKSEEFRLRHEMLTAMRKSTREELAEPDLAQLRSRIEQVVNSVLNDAPVKSVGFYQLTLR